MYTSLKMLTYSKKSIASVELTIGFEPTDSIRRLQFDFEEGLKDIIPGQSKAIDSLPNFQTGQPTPYWYMQDKNKTLVATDRSIGISLNFAGNAPQNGAIQVVQKYTAGLDRFAADRLRDLSIAFAGIVLISNWSYLGPEQNIHSDIARTFLRISEPAFVNNASTNIGFIGKPRFPWANINYQISVYRSYNFPITNLNFLEALQQAGANSLQVAEHGLQIRIDVNDKKRPDDDESLEERGTLSHLLDTLRFASTDGLSDYFGVENLELVGL